MHLAVVVLPEGNSILVAANLSDLVANLEQELDIFAPDSLPDLSGILESGQRVLEAEGLKVFISQHEGELLEKESVTHAILVRRFDEIRAYVATSDNDLMANSGKILSEWKGATRRVNPSEDVDIMIGSTAGSLKLRETYLERRAHSAEKIVPLSCMTRSAAPIEALCA